MPQLIKSKLRPWGNSLGLTVPREIVIKEDLKANDTLFFEIKKEIRVKDLIDIAKKVKHKKFDTAKALQESKKMWGMD